MQDKNTTNEVGVPVLSDIPMIGAAFRSHQDDIVKSELVVFIKATIINKSSDTLYPIDRELYRTFGADRRPSRL